MMMMKRKVISILKNRRILDLDWLGLRVFLALVFLIWGELLGWWGCVEGCEYCWVVVWRGSVVGLVSL